MTQALKWRIQQPIPCRAWSAKRDGDRRPSLDILMLAPTAFFSDYGCHVRILEEAMTLQEAGHHLSICTYHRGRSLPNLDIVRTPTIPWGNSYAMGSSWHKLVFDALLLARALVLRWKRPPDLIHAFLHEGALVGYLLARFWGIPLVFDYQGSLTGEMIDHGFLRQGSIMHRSLQHLECYINDLPDAIITSSSHAAQLLRDVFVCRCPLIHTVPDGVDAGRFCRQAVGQVQDLRQKLDLPAKGRIVAYLGKLAGYQGTDLLLEAAATLCTRQSDLHFLLMGYPQVDEYQAKASALGLGRSITFTGRIPYEEAPRYLALADVAVAPKLSETESNGKLLDYMAMGLPTVAFDTPVAREYLGKWGKYAAKQDASTLAATLEEVLLNQAEMGQLGQQLRARAIQLFSWRQAREKIEQIYGMLLANLPEKVVTPPYSDKVKI